MKPDSMLIDPTHILGAQKHVASEGTGQAFSYVAQSEPALAAYIHEALACVAGKLTLAGAPTELVQGTHEEVLGVVLTCVYTIRHGHYDLWKDTMTGTRLAQLDPSLEAKPALNGNENPKDGTHAEEGA